MTDRLTVFLHIPHHWAVEINPKYMYIKHFTVIELLNEIIYLNNKVILFISFAIQTDYTENI